MWGRKGWMVHLLARSLFCVLRWDILLLLYPSQPRSVDKYHREGKLDVILCLLSWVEILLASVRMGVGGGIRGGRRWVTCDEAGVSQWKKDGNLWCTSIVSRQIQSRHHEFGSYESSGYVDCEGFVFDCQSEKERPHETTVQIIPQYSIQWTFLNFYPCDTNVFFGRRNKTSVLSNTVVMVSQQSF